MSTAYASDDDRPGIDREGSSEFNMADAVDIERLRESMSWSAKQMLPFREQYLEAVKFFAGSRYGDQSMMDMTPVNMMKLAVEIWVRQLISQNPQTLVIPRSGNLQASAYELELALNFLLSKMRFGESMAETVRSGIFLFGAMKVGLTGEYLPKWSGYSAQGGQVFAEPVLVEDFLYDFNARRIGDWDWCANRYRVPYDVVMQNKEFDKAVRDKLAPGTDRISAGTGAGSDGDRTTDMAAGHAISQTEYRKHVELWDVWLPGDKLLVTMPYQDGLEPLQIREWDGPEHGPFHVLSFSQVPGCAMPVAPAQNLYELQDLLTQLFNKAGRQAKRQKTITIADGAAVADGTAQRVKDAPDGEVIQANHVDSVREMKYGGVDPSNFNFLVFLKDTFSYLAGNLDAMGGLSQQAETLGQEQLLVQSSSQMLMDMQSKVVMFASDVIKDLAWYLYSDPFVELPLVKPIEGFGDIPFTWGPDKRKDDFFAYDIKIEPYSLQSKGPQQRLSSLMQLTTQVLLPMAPQLSEWGMSFNLKKFVELVSRYSDLPELNDLISSDLPTEAEAAAPRTGTPGRRPLQSPSTTRTYVRKNASTGGTQQAKNAKLMNGLMQAAMAERE